LIGQVLGINLDYARPATTMPQSIAINPALNLNLSNKHAGHLAACKVCADRAAHMCMLCAHRSHWHRASTGLSMLAP
jgi:hypothetical protein